jgi:hypothetical protein
VVSSIALDIHFAGVEFSSMLRKITINMTMNAKFFGLLGHVSLSDLTFTDHFRALMKIYLPTWRKSIFAGKFIAQIKK